MARRILIDENMRLLTLTGTAGVGKTRLALSLGCDLLQDDVFSDGVWLVDLSSAVDPEVVPSLIAYAPALARVRRELDRGASLGQYGGSRAPPDPGQLRAPSTPFSH